MKKLIYILCLFLCFMLITTSCKDNSNYKDYSYQGIGPVMVEDVPEGYVSLEILGEEHNVSYSFNKALIVIQDSNGVTFYQASIADKGSVVQYKDDLYINESGFRIAFESTKYKDYSFYGMGFEERIGPVYVEEVPEGYVSAKTLSDEYQGFEIFLFEATVVIQDPNGVVVEQIMLNNRGFVVQSKDDLYFNEAKFKSIIDQSM